MSNHIEQSHHGDGRHRRDTPASSTGTLIVAWAMALLLSLPAVASAADTDRAHELLSDWQIEDVQQLVAGWETDNPSPAQSFVLARNDFLHGRYDRAQQRLDQLIAQDKTREDWKRLRKLVSATREVTKGYESYTTSDGRFEIYVEPGKDRVLVPFAGEALEAAYGAIGDALGYKPPTPIRVEVYPETASLAKVSGLTEQEIRTSGTIALCKYNRLMITSPKALLKGYEWVDTLIHEYIHYVINHRTKNKVPIWMHEGLAKFLERRWRGPDAHRLSPSSEHMLKTRLENDDLITFEQMHPSMAKLPSQEDAATAFAQVYTVMEFLRQKSGDDALERLLAAIEKGASARRAVERVSGTSFDAFQTEWKAYLRERPVPDYPEESDYDHTLVFKDQADDESEKLGEPDQPKAKDHKKLAEMMQGRGRYEAAAVQYRKALRLAKTPHPQMRAQLARSLSKTGSPQEAIDVLTPIRDLFPSFVTMWLELGRAHVAADQPDEAIDALTEAVRLNPFNPEIHSLLADAYDALDRPDDADRARKHADLVR